MADTWIFVRVDVEGLDVEGLDNEKERPSFTVVLSWEIDEKLEAATIVKILKSIVAGRRQSTN